MPCPLDIFFVEVFYSRKDDDQRVEAGEKTCAGGAVCVGESNLKIRMYLCIVCRVSICTKYHTILTLRRVPLPRGRNPIPEPAHREISPLLTMDSRSRIVRIDKI